MPIEYCINSRLNTVFLRAWGHVSVEEVFDVTETLRDDPDFHPDGKGVYDLSGVTSTNYYYKQMKEIMLIEPWGGNSKRAVIVKSALVFGLTRTFILLAKKSHGKIAIFNDMGHAAKNLDIQASDVPWCAEIPPPIISPFKRMVDVFKFKRKAL
ncbi:hypothetical protein Ga0123461_0137 [Mariprofundus aestuarium]|uniref:Uncharacterized protein n=1 Tax=Mariprofundus aestuarium TaxID=1921086 RepID=A0A2K8KV06_MARES|nr:hypothetical protein [Mariprofundus aestuarium]ATX78590.1 hypothetical protein Ga0123461_0137 [Mariprofundus aestuarium]